MCASVWFSVANMPHAFTTKPLILVSLFSTCVTRQMPSCVHRIWHPQINFVKCFQNVLPPTVFGSSPPPTANRPPPQKHLYNLLLELLRLLSSTLHTHTEGFQCAIGGRKKGKCIWLQLGTQLAITFNRGAHIHVCVCVLQSPKNQFNNEN